MIATSGRIHWLALGGTIQSLGQDPLDIDRYHLSGGTLRPAELITPVSELVGEVTSEELPLSPSHDITPEAVVRLLGRVRELRATDTDHPPVGFVVTCGSNGMEELAYLLWLLHDGPEPIVVTAAMWPPTAVGSDALSNLVGAIAAARVRPTSGPASGAEARRTPVLVSTDGAVLHPVASFKTHTSRRDAFRASAEPVGSVWPGDQVALRSGTTTSPLAGARLHEGLARVDVAYSFLGADGLTIDAAVAAGARGIVCAGMGAGFGARDERRAVLAALDAGVEVCQASRTPFGAVALPARTSLDERLLLGGRLTPQKARLALSLGLAAGLDRPALQDLLDTPALLDGELGL